MSTFVAGPLAGLIIAIAVIAGYPAGEVQDTPVAMLLIWGPLTGFFYASLPAAVFGAGIGQYVRQRLAKGWSERMLRPHALVAGAALGASFAAALHWLGGVGAS
jgi:hypothetical protein